MGSLLQLLQTVGRTEYKMFHILVISCLAVTALAEPGYYTQNYWPTRVGPYSYSTCYGCYGKRSADAEPGYLRSYGYGLGLRSYGYGLGLRSYGYVSVASVPELDSTSLVLFMSPDLPRVLASVAPMLSQVTSDL